MLRKRCVETEILLKREIFSMGSLFELFLGFLDFLEQAENKTEEKERMSTPLRKSFDRLGAAPTLLAKGNVAVGESVESKAEGRKDAAEAVC